MKKVILSSLLALVSTVGAFAQGTVTFVTTNANVNVKVFDLDHTTALSGTGFYAQLYAADGNNVASASLTAKGNPVNFRAGSFVGYVQVSGSSQPNNLAVNTSVLVTSQDTSVIGSQTPITLQMRAWSSAFSSYSVAVSSGGKFGQSTTFNSTIIGGSTPPDLTGLTSFSLQQSPEPTTIALGLMGAASLLIVRRRK